MLRTTLKTIPKHYNNKLLISRLIHPTIITATNIRTIRRFQSSLTAETSYEEEQENNVNIKTPINTTPLNGRFFFCLYLLRGVVYLLFSLF